MLLILSFLDPTLLRTKLASAIFYTALPFVLDISHERLAQNQS